MGAKTERHVKVSFVSSFHSLASSFFGIVVVWQGLCQEDILTDKERKRELEKCTAKLSRPSRAKFNRYRFAYRLSFYLNLCTFSLSVLVFFLSFILFYVSLT